VIYTLKIFNQSNHAVAGSVASVHVQYVMPFAKDYDCAIMIFGRDNTH
jgi:hypothetical protein